MPTWAVSLSTAIGVIVVAVVAYKIGYAVGRDIEARKTADAARKQRTTEATRGTLGGKRARWDDR